METSPSAIFPSDRPWPFSFSGCAKAQFPAGDGWRRRRGCFANVEQEIAAVIAAVLDVKSTVAGRILATFAAQRVWLPTLQGDVEQGWVSKAVVLEVDLACSQLSGTSLRRLSKWTVMRPFGGA